MDGDGFAQLIVKQLLMTAVNANARATRRGPLRLKDLLARGSDQWFRSLSSRRGGSLDGHSRYQVDRALKTSNKYRSEGTSTASPTSKAMMRSLSVATGAAAPSTVTAGGTSNGN